MSHDSTQDDTSELDQRRDELKRQLALYGICLIIGSAVFAAPAAAQTSNPICAQDSMQPVEDILNAIIQLAFFGGVVGSIVTYFGTQAVEAAPVSENRREQLKSLRKRTFGASIKMVVAGPAILFILDGVININCLNLIPFQ